MERQSFGDTLRKLNAASCLASSGLVERFAATMDQSLRSIRKRLCAAVYTHSGRCSAFRENFPGSFHMEREGPAPRDNAAMNPAQLRRLDNRIQDKTRRM